jgi:hypothetical protein
MSIKESAMTVADEVEAGVFSLSEQKVHDFKVEILIQYGYSRKGAELVAGAKRDDGWPIDWHVAADALSCGNETLALYLCGATDYYYPDETP